MSSTKAEVQRARAQAVPDRIGPDDPRYAALVGRGFNKRFTGKPDYVRLVQSTDDVIGAVQDAVREGRRVVARGGGHCLEGFVDDPDVRVIIDTSLMTGVRYEPGMGAFEIDAGTTLGEAYRRLFLQWGVTIPAGESPYLGLRKRFTDRQIDTAHQYLTRSDYDVAGGVPVPGDICDGAMINHPDVDLANPEWNTSAVPWHTLYFKSNYAALQRVKRRWDPRNVSHHALSIRP